MVIQVCHGDEGLSLPEVPQFAWDFGARVAEGCAGAWFLHLSKGDHSRGCMCCLRCTFLFCQP